MATVYTGPIRTANDARKVGDALRRRGEHAAASYLAASWQRVAARPDLARRMLALAGMPESPR